MRNEKNPTSSLNNPASHSQPLTSYENRNWKFRWGFTLIEFLVVIGILALVVGSITLFLTAVLRGTNQANITAEVKQNGQAVLDSLERQIRGAVGAESIDSNHLKIIREGAEPMHIKCLSKNANQNGRIGTAVVPAGSPVDYDPPISNYISVSNDDPVSGVNIEDSNCNFSVIPSNFSNSLNAPAVVSISFVATQAINAPQRVDFQAQAQFKTTISLRTYK